MARRSGGILVAVVVLLVAGPIPALAKGPPPIYSDPQANSPAGTIYAIPLDSARQDAAPHGHAGSGAAGAGHARSAAGGVAGYGTSGGGGSGSGGVGGGTGGGAGATGAAPGNASGSSTGSNRAATPATLIPGGQPGSLVHSSNGFGSSSAVPGLNAPASAGYKAIAGSPSDAPVLAIVLSFVVILLGAFTGSRAWRVARAGS